MIYESPYAEKPNETSEGELLAGVEQAANYTGAHLMDVHTAALSAMVNNSYEVVSKAVAEDIVNGHGSQSPIVQAYNSIAARRARRIIAPVAAFALAGAGTLGVLNIIGQAKYEVGSTAGMNYAPIMERSSLGFNESGLLSLASKDPQTGEVSYDPTVPTLIASFGIIGGLGAAAGTVALSTSPNGMRRTAQNELKKRQKS